MTSIIVACDSKRGIGKEGDIPWYLPEDLQIFKARTTGAAVIMGRITWESIPKKPLRHRLNIVITSKPTEMKETYPRHTLWGPIFTDSLANAMKICEENQFPKVFVIGGESIYKSALESGIINEVVMTQVPGDHGCDRFFPELGEGWKRDEVSVHVGFEVVNYLKT